MFDARTVVAGAALAAVACATPLPGQQHTVPDSALRDVRRLDSLYEVRLAALLHVRDSLRHVAGWVDVSEAGLTIRTTPALAACTRQAAHDAMAGVQRRGGEGLRLRLTRHLPVLLSDSTAAILGTELVVRLQADTGNRDRNLVTYQSRGPVRAHALVPPFVNLVERFALDGADSALTSWLMLERLPLRDAPRTTWEDAYSELATTESSRARACRSGDDEACLTTLGLGVRAQSPLEAWYDPADYRALVETARVARPDSGSAASARRCYESADASDCAAAARSIPDFKIPVPLSADTRQLFVEEVFRAGGTGAYDRLVSAHGSVREQLTAAAGVPLDSVVSAWRARVLAARPEPMMVTPLVALAALMWCGAFTAVALGRRGA